MSKLHLWQLSLSLVAPIPEPRLSLSSMDVLIEDFATAQDARSGPKLAATLSPESPAEDPDRLHRIWVSASFNDIKTTIRRKIQNNGSSRTLSNDEVIGWTDVYYAYWKAVGELLALEEDGGKGKVRLAQQPATARGSPCDCLLTLFSNRLSQTSWTKVYDAWKDVVLALHRGFTNQGFEAWTIPCLYIGGKYLRIFAIKGDNDRNASSNDNSTATLQDDFDPESEKNQLQEDCARQLNRLFQLCLSDRYGPPRRGGRIHRLTDRIKKSRSDGLQKMGHLQHHQSPLQDVLQAERGESFEKRSQGASCLQRRPTAPRVIS